MDAGTKILNLALDPVDNELGAVTVREYMARTLATYYHQGYQFDGKYAFEGQWERPIVWALADADLIEGTWEYDAGERFSFEEADQAQARALIMAALDRLARP